MDIVEEFRRGWPVRERKAVERLSFLNSEKALATKAVIIKKGKGMQLNDIPNVAYNLSKGKADDNLQKLHTVLFRKKSNLLVCLKRLVSVQKLTATSVLQKYYLKRNIRQLSGFVWDKNEDKERAIIRERINKCVKKSLFDFCKLLNIPVSRASKKEVFSEKLLEFLESPQATTEVSLAERSEQAQRGKRRGRMTRGKMATSAREEAAGSSDESLRRNSEVSKTDKHRYEPQVEEEARDDSLSHEGGNLVTQLQQQKKYTRNIQRKRTSKEQVQGSSKKKKTALDQMNSTSRPVRRKGKHVATKANAPRKQELLPVVENILAEVDLEVATFEDIHMQLEKQFNLDFSNRKVEVRRIIEETLLNMTVFESEDEEETENNEDADE